MNYQLIREKRNFSEVEMSILLNVPAAKVRRLEAGEEEPDDALKALYHQLENESQIPDFFKSVCERTYATVQEVKLVRSLLPRFSSEERTRAYLEHLLLRNNNQFDPSDIGWKVTRVYPSRKGK